MRTEDEIRARRNTDHYRAETSVTFHCEIDGDICDQEEGTFTDQTPDCCDCEKHKKWVLNDKADVRDMMARVQPKPKGFIGPGLMDDKDGG